MIIAVASGKGGTGKTTLSVSLAQTAAQAGRRVELLDCDVEEPNCRLFFECRMEPSEPVTMPVPQIDQERCDLCGTCAEVCEFNAIACLPKKVIVASELCHGCGGCLRFCPTGAISETTRQLGICSIGQANGFRFIEGRLRVGEPMAPPVIRAVRKRIESDDFVIIDAPPGTSCPVIAAVKNVDYVVLVTEPTPFGLNDLQLAVEMIRQVGLDFGVVLNRSDAGDGQVEDYCRRENVPIILRIPHDRRIAEAYSRGESIVESLPEYQALFENFYQKLCAIDSQSFASGQAAAGEAGS